MGNVCQQLRSVVEDTPQRVAIRGETETLTYADLWKETNAFAGALRDYDVGAGDLVAIATELEQDAVVAVLGALRNGSVVLPLPEAHSQSVLKETLSTCSPATIVADPDRNRTMYLAEDAVDFHCRVVTGESQFGIDFDRFVGRVEDDEDDSGGGLWEKVSRLGSSSGSERPGLADYWEVIDRDSSDPAVVARMSHDDPQYAVYTHGQLQSSIDVARTPSGLQSDDVLLSTCPPTTVEAITTVVGATLFGGSTLAIPGNEEPESLRRAVDNFETSIALIREEPLEQVIDAATNAATSIRSLGMLGPTPKLAHLETIDTELSVTAFQLAGLPGSAGPTHATHGDGPFRPGSIGRPLPDVQLRILDGGECPPTDDPGDPEQRSIGQLYSAGDRIATASVGGELDGINRDGLRWTDTGLQAYRTERGHYHLYDDERT